jgi:hypothetical protein
MVRPAVGEVVESKKMKDVWCKELRKSSIGDYWYVSPDINRRFLLEDIVTPKELSYVVINDRIKKGYDLDKVLYTGPLQSKQNPDVGYMGLTMSLINWAEKLGTTADAIQVRMDSEGIDFAEVVRTTPRDGMSEAFATELRLMTEPLVPRKTNRTPLYCSPEDHKKNWIW